MNTKPAGQVIKHGEGKALDIKAEVESAAGPNRWSTAVRSWVVEFQEHGPGESPPDFDSLFKDALP